MLHHRIRHLRIDEDFRAGEPLHLDVAGSQHSRGHVGGRFFTDPVHQFLRADHFHIQLDVDPVHYRPGEPAHIGLPLGRRAGTSVTSPVIAAGAGIGCCHQGERGREFHLGTQPGDGHLPVFKRASEGFGDTFRHLGELVQEENPVMCEGDLPGLDVVPVSPADDGCEGCAVMRGPERPPLHQSAGPHARHGVDLAGHDGLFPAQGRHYPHHCLGQ